MKNNSPKNDTTENHYPPKLPSTFELTLIGAQLWGKPLRMDNGSTLPNGDPGYDEDIILGNEDCISTAYKMWIYADQFLTQKKANIIQLSPIKKKYDTDNTNQQSILDAYKSFNIELVHTHDPINLNKLATTLIPNIEDPESILVRIAKIDTILTKTGDNYLGSEISIAITCLYSKIRLIKKQRYEYFSNLRNKVKNKTEMPGKFKLTDYKRVIAEDWRPLLRFIDEKPSLNENQ